MLSLSVAIMHVASSTERAANVPHLLAAFPEATIVEDRGRGVWDTARRAWECAAGTHHLVLQDDAWLAPNFEDRAKESLVGLTSPLGFARAPAHRDIPSGLAICMPSAMGRRWLAWCAQLPPDRLRHDNVLLWSWAMRHRVEIRMDARRLVASRGYPSLLGHDPRP
jgi:hypothetical protein